MFAFSQYSPSLKIKKIDLKCEVSEEQKKQLDDQLKERLEIDLKLHVMLVKSLNIELVEKEIITRDQADNAENYLTTKYFRNGMEKR